MKLYLIKDKLKLNFYIYNYFGPYWVIFRTELGHVEKKNVKGRTCNRVQAAWCVPPSTTRVHQPIWRTCASLIFCIFSPFGRWSHGTLFDTTSVAFFFFSLYSFSRISSLLIWIIWLIFHSLWIWCYSMSEREGEREGKKNVSGYNILVLISPTIFLFRKKKYIIFFFKNYDS